VVRAVHGAYVAAECCEPLQGVGGGVEGRTAVVNPAVVIEQLADELVLADFTAPCVSRPGNGSPRSLTAWQSIGAWRAGWPDQGEGSGVSAGLAFWASMSACWENQASDAGDAGGSVKTELVWRLHSGSNVWKAALELAGQPGMGGV
jgi:hypothetical protein